MKKGIFLITMVLPVVISGCSILPTNWGRDEGLAWCDERYLDMSYAKETDRTNLTKKLRLSQKGYLYSTAAVLALQHPSKDKEYNFLRPEYLQPIPDLTEERISGFSALTFSAKPPHTDIKTTIIAFTGSDQWRDYILHNAWLFPVQYKPARDYVLKVVNDPRIKGTKIVVTGYSLGGSLAAHVTKHPKTSTYISEAWTFNPSPRVGWGIPTTTDERIYMLATSYEVLGVFKRNKIGAVPQHRDETFDLIRSSSIHSHYRWILGRQILQYADLAEYNASGKKAQTTAPLEILKTFSKKCRPQDLERIKSWRETFRQAGT